MVGLHVLKDLGIGRADPRLQPVEKGGQPAEEQVARALVLPLLRELGSGRRARLEDLELRPDGVAELLESAALLETLEELLAPAAVGAAGRVSSSSRAAVCQGEPLCRVQSRACAARTIRCAEAALVLSRILPVD